jgi:hypothetical protein
MSISLPPLQPQEEARIAAAAQARGLTTKALLREAIDKILETAPEQPLKPRKSAYGLLAQYGPGPSGAEIDENRREMFHGFAKDL